MKAEGRSHVAAAAGTLKLRPERANQPVAFGRMRYVLAVSLALTIVAFAVIYATYF